MKLIMENWKRFLKEDKELDNAEYLLSQMSIEARADIVRAVREAILGHAPPSEEGVAFVRDRLGRHGDAELEENEEELVPMISLFLADPGAFTELRQKFDLGGVDPDDYEYAL